jgi:ACS family glucarate transporter-like MFS transporter
MLPGSAPDIAGPREVIGRSPAQGQPSRRAALIVILMLGLSIMSYFDRIIMSVTGPAILREFSLTATELGAIYSSFMVCYALFMIPGGRLADRYGPRRLLTLMAIGSAALTALTSLGGKPGLGALIGVVPSFILIRTLLGAVSAPVYPACARMNTNWKPPHERARTWGWIAAGSGIGGALAPLLLPGLIATQGWRQAFWIAGGATFLLGVVWHFSATDYPDAHQQLHASGSQSHARPWRELLQNRDLLLLSLSYLTVNYFEYIFFYWPYYYFSQVRHTSLANTAIYTTAIWISWAIMTPVGGWAADRLGVRFGRRIGLRIIPIVTLSLGAVFTFFGARLSDPLGAAILMCLALGLAAATEGPYWTAAMEVGARQSGAASATLNTGGNIGGFLAPVLTPWIAQFAGWEWGLYAGCIVVLAGVLVWFWIGLYPNADHD